MSADSHSPHPDPVITTVLHDPAKDEAEHAHEQGHAFDSPEEVAHAKEHAIDNMKWFAVFFTIILISVANYELNGLKYMWAIYLLAAIRALTIAFFMNWLFGRFSLVFRTIAFTVFFFAGMVFLSMWDSELPIYGDPIKLPPKYDQAPLPTAKP